MNLTGDTRCDSPGHGALFRTYSLMGMNSRKIVAVQVLKLSCVHDKQTCGHYMHRVVFMACIELCI